MGNPVTPSNINGVVDGMAGEEISFPLREIKLIGSEFRDGQIALPVARFVSQKRQDSLNPCEPVSIEA